MSPPPLKYYDIFAMKKRPEMVRLAVVQYAQEHGLRATARACGMSLRTVWKWVHRYDGTLESLRDRSRAPRRRPRRIPEALEKRIVSLRRQLPTWGAERLRQDFELPCSAKAIRRVLHGQGLIGRRRWKKHQRKQDLRALKQQWRLFQQLQVDTKDLWDIPNYAVPMERYRLPRYLYTAREVVSGMVFTAYARERALVYSRLFLDRLLKHLKACGVDLRQVTVQTDNGSEFIGSWQKKGPSGFTELIERKQGATHRTIPPRSPTFQSDVEAFHGRIEAELFDVEQFTSPTDFLQSAITYQLFFNYLRPNRSKGGRTPWQILHERDPTLSPQIGALPPLFLESLLPSVSSPTLPKPPQVFYHVWSSDNIGFNPKRSINCQARSCALYVVLLREGILEDVLDDRTEFLRLLNCAPFYARTGERDGQKMLFDFQKPLGN